MCGRLIAITVLFPLYLWANPTQAQSKPNPIDTKIKACLTSIYSNQIIFHKGSGKYTRTIEDMGADRNEDCSGLYIQTDVANEKEFKIKAQLGNIKWSVDQKKNLIKLR